MPIKQVVMNDEHMCVNKIEVIEFVPKYHKTATKTLLINDEYIVKQGDEIVWECDICHVEYKTKFFSRHDRFFSEEISCRSCSVKRTFNKRSDEIHNKMKKTMKEKYGIEHAMQSEKIQEKIRQTSMKKYGVEHFSQSKEIIEKRQETNIKKYGYSTILKDREKMESAMEAKYGVRHNNYHEPSNQKRKETCEKKYGGILNGSSQIQKKIKDTNLDRYGSENPFGSKEIQDKIKTTNMEKYGVKNPSQNEKVKDKIRKSNEATCMEKYGVKSVLQVEEIYNKGYIKKEQNGTHGHGGKCKWYDIGGQQVQGLFEVKIVEILNRNNVQWIAHKIKGIRYVRDGKTRYYHPDFYLPEYNLYIEPHAKYFWNDDFEYKINQCKEKGFNIIAFTETDDCESIIMEAIRGKQCQ